MGDGFGVHTDEMRAHAKNVEAVAQQLKVAVDAAHTVSMPSDAYGILCSPLLVPLISALESVGVTTLDTGAAATGATATGIRAMADGYDAVDQAVHDALNEVERALTGGGS